MTTSPVLTVTDELIAELEAAAHAATRGPWRRQHPNDGQRGMEVAACGGIEQVAADLTAENADFIAAADPAVILALLAERAELKKCADRYRDIRALTVKAQGCTGDEFDAEFDIQIADAMQAAQ